MTDRSVSGETRNRASACAALSCCFFVLMFVISSRIAEWNRLFVVDACAQVCGLRGCAYNWAGSVAKAPIQTGHGQERKDKRRTMCCGGGNF